MSPLGPFDRDEWVTERYGKTPDELRADAVREHAMGNSLVAYCLWEAAHGRIPEKGHKRARWVQIALFALAILCGVVAFWTGVV